MNLQKNKGAKYQSIILSGLVLLALVIAQCKTKMDLTLAPNLEGLSFYEEFIELNAGKEEAFIAVQRLAESYIKSRKWEEAISIYSKYKPLFPDMATRFDKIIFTLNDEEEGLEIANLGDGINTDGQEYAPVPSADGTLLYFTGRNRSKTLGKEDIFVSNYEGGKWQTAKNIGKKINTKQRSESLDGISMDGNTLLMMGLFEGGFGDSDIYFVERTSTGWGEIKHFPDPINSEYFDANAVLTADGKAVIFTSDRPGGIGEFHKKGSYYHGAYVGNTDIYVCTKTPEGWSKPINLGSVVNTPFCEYTPFLHPDGKTLYFSSDGHYGLGRLDVYKTVRQSDSLWTLWSKPVNLGKEINTTGDDWGYKITTSGDIAYFSANSQNEGFGGDDLYSIRLPQIVQPDPVAIIKGFVSDNNTNPLQVKIIWEDLTAEQTMGDCISNAEDGSYFIVLPLNKNYGYHVSKSGYYPVSKNVNLLDIHTQTEIENNIVMISIEEMIIEEISIKINNVFFEYDKFELLPESYPELKRLAKILKENQENKVEVSGHTDNMGSDEYNLILSENRAQAVVNYLIAEGCQNTSLIAKGYGEQKPVDTNETEVGRANNRRVEFQYIRNTD